MSVTPLGFLSSGVVGAMGAAVAHLSAASPEVTAIVGCGGLVLGLVVQAMAPSADSAVTQALATKKSKGKKKGKAAKAAPPKAAPAPVVEEDESESEAEVPAVEEPKKKKKKNKKKEPVVEQKTPAKAQDKQTKAEVKAAPKAPAKAVQKTEAKKTAAKKEEKKAPKAEGKEKKKESAKEAAKRAAAEAKALEDEGWSTVSSKSSRSRAKPATVEAKVAAAAEDDPDKPLVVELEIAPKFYGRIIGEKGATLDTIKNATGAKITMPARDSASTAIVLEGPTASVSLAKKAIEDLVAKGYSSVTSPGTVHNEVSIEAAQFGALIGPGGAHVRAIQAKTNTRINLPEKGGASTKVTIIGDREDVKAAKAAIKQLLTDGFSSATHPDWVKKEIEVPHDMLRFVIGTKGQTIKSIQGNTKCRIRTPKAGDENPDLVVIIGTPAGVAQAEKEILRALEPPEKQSPFGEEDEEEERARAADPTNPFSEAAAAAYDEDNLW